MLNMPGLICHLCVVYLLSKSHLLLCTGSEEICTEGNHMECFVEGVGN